MRIKQFFVKKILLISTSTVVLPILSIVSCSKEFDLLRDFSILAEDEKQLNESFPLNIDVLFDRKEDFYKRLMEYEPYRSASEGKNSLGISENGVIKPYNLDDLIKIKDAFVAYIIALKQKIGSLLNEIKSLNPSTDKQKIDELVVKQKTASDDLEKFRSAISSQIQQSVKVLLIANQEPLKNITASEFIKIHNEYKNQNIDFVDYLNTKIPGLDKEKPIFRIHILRRVRSTEFEGVFNLDYLLDIFPFFNITRALKTKEQLETDVEISRIANKDLNNSVNLDSNMNLFTNSFANETVSDSDGIFTYGDGLYISALGDITFLSAAGFYVAGFKKN